MEKITNVCSNCGRECAASAHLKYCSLSCLGFHSTSLIMIDGKEKTLKEWCELYGTDRLLVRYRVLTGRWSIQDAIKAPPKEWVGQSKEPEYGIYRNMITRCTNPNNQDFSRYGSRGIKVCDRWLGKNGYQNFKKDMGPRPSNDYSIDRIDVNKGYSPNNCKWATAKEQANNQVRTQYLEVAGIKKPISYWAEEIGVSKYTIRHRLERGWSVEEALLIPALKPNASISEDDIQKALVQWLELRGYKFWHTANEVWTPSWSQKMRNKQMGVKAGVPDLTIFVPTASGVVTLYLEVKTEKGVMSGSQKEWQEILEGVNGVEFRCAQGLDECISIIEAIRSRELYDQDNDFFLHKIAEKREKTAKNKKKQEKNTCPF